MFEVGFLCSGPGCSSMGGGAFTELGPFYPKGDGRGLRRNSMSWNRGTGHKMLFGLAYAPVNVLTTVQFC